MVAMQLACLVEVVSKVRATTKKTEKTTLLADFLRGPFDPAQGKARGGKQNWLRSISPALYLRVSWEAAGA
jgi:hypothetical protein